MEALHMSSPNASANQLVKGLAKNYSSLNPGHITELDIEFSPETDLFQIAQSVRQSFPGLTTNGLILALARLLAATGTAPLQASQLFQQLKLDRFDGIIATLTRECSGNVHDQTVVTVTSSKPFKSRPPFAAKNVVDLGSDDCFCSAYRTGKAIRSGRNPWICYNFRQRAIISVCYTIRSQMNRGKKSEADNRFLKSWMVEGSKNGKSWVPIDCRDDRVELCGYGAVGTFNISERDLCHYIRLTNIGANSAGDDCPAISALEIFGAVSK
jgi:hypothetical protein